MADLSTDDRTAVWSGCMVSIDADCLSGDLTKDEYKSAISTFDAWIGTTLIPSIPMLLPVDVRNAITTKEQLKMVAALLCKRVQEGVF